MARVFISHSSRDREQATEIFAWLKAEGFEQGFLDIDKHQGIPPGSLSHWRDETAGVVRSEGVPGGHFEAPKR